jgi:hypothetical protein
MNGDAWGADGGEDDPQPNETGHVVEKDENDLTRRLSKKRWRSRPKEACAIRLDKRCRAN